MQMVFVNPERCIGCLQCELACAVEHSASNETSAAFLEAPVPRKRVHVEAGPVPTFSFPSTCRHCDPAPCLQVCPTGAITRDSELGFVLVDAKRCIGCAMCAVVCPFDVLTFHELADGPQPPVKVAVKCDGCVDRVRRGEVPACAEICKVDALVFGEVNELVATGRLREAGRVLAAEAGSSPEGRSADPLAPWHGWGRAVASSSARTNGAARTASNNGGGPP